MADPTDKAREEFLSEAQEIIETLSRNLLGLDSVMKAGGSDPALVNEAFRAVHTLKGLAGLFGASEMGALSHRLEDILDALRLGRMALSSEVLDTLFSAVEVYGRVLKAESKRESAADPRYDALLQNLDRLGAASHVGTTSEVDYDLDPGMLAVLTEYEEHRLRVNVEQKQRLYRLRVTFDLATIDTALEDIKERAKRHGEIITYLPTGETSTPDSIELDLLLASRDDLAMLVGSLGADNIVIDEIPRKRGASLAAPRASTPVQAAGPHDIGRVGSELELPQGEGSLRALTRTVRVDIRKLDRLMNIVGELAIVRGMLGRVSEKLRRDVARPISMELLRLQRNFDRRLGELQDGILEVRMVPLGQVFDRLARVVRQIGRELGKEIRLVITGSETEIDKLIVEELSDPLMHMIRNAIDHGIEAVEEREKVGKPRAGTIALNAFQKGNHVMIEIEDDGRGIDEARLVEKAIQMGKLSAAEAGELSRDQALGLIFVPGLSTRAQVSDLSGRGVGMDVVKTNMSKLGGVIDVHSEAGIGTKMTITLPITLAIVSALLVEIAGETYAVALSSVSEAIVLDESAIHVVDGRETTTLRGSTLPLCRLSRLLGLPEKSGVARRFVVVANQGNRRLGLIVDHLFGQQDIVIKSLGQSLRNARGIAGATELGDQRVGLVLDTAALIEEVLIGTDVKVMLGSVGVG